jgi:hypothetical protein
MDRPVARPVQNRSTELPVSGASAPETEKEVASPQLKRKPRPGWKATIVRDTTFNELRRIQKSTIDPVIDLSYLTDACVAIALEIGRDRIVQRAVASFAAPSSSN